MPAMCRAPRRATAAPGVMPVVRSGRCARTVAGGAIGREALDVAAVAIAHAVASRLHRPLKAASPIMSLLRLYR
jgi:hypothetical protein